MLVANEDKAANAGTSKPKNITSDNAASAMGRKTVTKRMLADYPAFVRVYDLLGVDGNDLRLLPWTERRRQLEAFVPRLAISHFDLSQVIEARD